MSRRLLIPICSLILLTVAACSRSQPDGSAQTSTEPADVGTVEIATGTFVDKGGQKTSGSFVIERTGENLRLVLGDDFRTDEGPDLHVVLSPTSLAAAVNDNATPEGAEIVGRLAAQAGRQVYDLRDDLIVDRYNSILIHCVEFSHLYGAAPLH